MSPPRGASLLPPAVFLSSLRHLPGSLPELPSAQPLGWFFTCPAHSSLWGDQPHFPLRNHPHPLSSWFWWGCLHPQALHVNTHAESASPCVHLATAIGWEKNMWPKPAEWNATPGVLLVLAGKRRFLSAKVSKSVDWKRGVMGSPPADACLRMKLIKRNAKQKGWRKQWQPTWELLPGESQGRGRLVGCCLWSCTEPDTTEAT